jgi:hypothetical protein
MRPNNTVHAYINWAIASTMKLQAPGASSATCAPQCSNSQLIPVVAQGNLHSHVYINDHKIHVFFPNMLHITKLRQNLLLSNTILKNRYRI